MVDLRGSRRAAISGQTSAPAPWKPNGARSGSLNRDLRLKCNLICALRPVRCRDEGLLGCLRGDPACQRMGEECGDLGARLLGFRHPGRDVEGVPHALENAEFRRHMAAAHLAIKTHAIAEEK